MIFYGAAEVLQQDAIDLIYLATTWDYNSTLLNCLSSTQTHPVSTEVTRERRSAKTSKLQKLLQQKIAQLRALRWCEANAYNSGVLEP